MSTPNHARIAALAQLLRNEALGTTGPEMYVCVESGVLLELLNAFAPVIEGHPIVLECSAAETALRVSMQQSAGPVIPIKAGTRAVTWEQIKAESAQEEWYAVLNPSRNEGVIFKSERDAKWTASGRLVSGVSGFSVPTIGDAFRDSYDDTSRFEMLKVKLADAATTGGALQ